jgi:hypothetical protein
VGWSIGYGRPGENSMKITDADIRSLVVVFGVGGFDNTRDAKDSVFDPGVGFGEASSRGR